MDKVQSKQDISNLIIKHQKLTDTDRIKDFNEAQTVNEFILPLFQFLGWDIHNINKPVTTQFVNYKELTLQPFLKEVCK